MKKVFVLITLFIIGGVTFYYFFRQPPSPPFVCSDEIGCVTITPKQPVRIGVIQDLSGSAVSYGMDQLRGIQLAIGKHGNKLLRHPIELQLEDEKCSAAGGSVAANKLVTDPQVVAILGTTCSGSAVTASKVMSNAGLVMISGLNSAPSLTRVRNKRGKNWQSGYFRTTTTLTEIGSGAAKYVFQELGITKVATINDRDTFSKGYSDAFGYSFKALGGKIVLDAVINKEEKNMRPVLTAVVNSGAQLLFFPIFEQDGALLVQQSKVFAQLRNVVFLGGGTLLTEKFIQAIGDDGKGVYFIDAVPASKKEKQNALIAEFEKVYGESPQTATYDYAYDAANLLLNAIKTVAIQERNGTIHIGRQALRNELYATNNFPGVTGYLSCNEFGDCSVPKFNIVRMDETKAGLKAVKSNVIYSSIK